MINGQIYYTHNDHLGTPRVLTDENQQVVWAASYTPFGEASLTVEGIENNLRFPGQYFDEETQLHYNWFRYCSPETGRYITPDLIGINKDYSDPQLQIAIELGVLEKTDFSDNEDGFANYNINHVYSYVNQNTLIFFDENGLASKGVRTVVGIACIIAGASLTDGNIDRSLGRVRRAYDPDRKAFATLMCPPPPKISGCK